MLLESLLTANNAAYRLCSHRCFSFAFNHRSLPVTRVSPLLSRVASKMCGGSILGDGEEKTNPERKKKPPIGADPD
jgi:hypothetical protein